MKHVVKEVAVHFSHRSLALPQSSDVARRRGAMKCARWARARLRENHNEAEQEPKAVI